MPTSSDVLNSEALAILRSLQIPGEPDFLKEIYDLFIQKTPQHLERLEKTLTERNEQAFRSTAHALKGSCMQIGANVMMEISAYLEKMNPEDFPKKAEDALEKLKAAYATTTSALAKEVG